MKTFNIKITEEALAVMMSALECYSRLGINQFRYCLEHNPAFEKLSYEKRHEIENFLKSHIDSRNFGIYHPKVTTFNKAFQIKKEIQKVLAVSKNPIVDNFTNEYDGALGDYDYVPGVITEAGFKTLFQSIAVQPGKPSVFAVKDNKYLFGLPGNPVSSFVQFELLVKTLINKITGCTDPPVIVRLPLGKDYTRRRTDRKSFLPVKIILNEVFPLEYHGSAHIHAYVEADGIIAVNIGETEIKKGTLADVRQL